MGGSGEGLSNSKGHCFHLSFYNFVTIFGVLLTLLWHIANMLLFFLSLFLSSFLGFVFFGLRNSSPTKQAKIKIYSDTNI